MSLRPFLLIGSTLFLALLAPLAASAQFKDLTTATSSLERGFGQGDPQAVVAGISPADQVELQFPRMIDQSGFFGRDQAAYLFSQLFNKVHPTRFKLVSTRKVPATGQCVIKAMWTVSINGGSSVHLNITLRNKGNAWSLVSVSTS